MFKVSQFQSQPTTGLYYGFLMNAIIQEYGQAHFALKYDFKFCKNNILSLHWRSTLSEQKIR